MPVEDLSLEEGLLANEEGQEAEVEGDDKEELHTVIVSSPKVPDVDRDGDKSVAL